MTRAEAGEVAERIVNMRVVDVVVEGGVLMLDLAAAGTDDGRTRLAVAIQHAVADEWPWEEE